MPKIQIIIKGDAPGIGKSLLAEYFSCQLESVGVTSEVCNTSVMPKLMNLLLTLRRVIHDRNVEIEIIDAEGYKVN